MKPAEVADEIAREVTRILEREGLATGRVVVGISMWEDAHAVHVDDEGELSCGGLHCLASAVVPMPRASSRGEALVRLAMGFVKSAEAVHESAERVAAGGASEVMFASVKKGTRH